MIINDYLASTQDKYAAVDAKPSLSQWDNYQIYDLYCTDRNFEKKKNAVIELKTEQFKDFLAVQAYSPDPILCNFDAIVKAYE